MRVGLGAWVVVVMARAGRPEGGIDGQCTSAMDCHLNGDCVAGVCVCDAAWGGSSDW